MTTETKAKHTPGPWRIVESNYDNGVTDIRGPKFKDGSSDYIATMSGCDETPANARLIASAPELLEALEALTEAVYFKARYGTIIPDELKSKAEAAITKAKGGQL